MKLGGYDFIKKPFELEEIVAAVRNAVRTSRLEQRVAYLAAQDRRRSGGAAFVHASPAMDSAVVRGGRHRAEPRAAWCWSPAKAAPASRPSPACCTKARRAPAGPFVELNCSAIPENLVESELFGHERGAFSDARERKLGLVEIADGGTLFLDEIGDLGAGGPGQAADVPRAADVPPRRRDRRAPRGRARRGRHQPQPDGGRGRARVPRRPLLSNQRHHRAPAAAARPPERRPRRWPSTSWASPRANSGGGSGPWRPRRPACSNAIAGRATCASCAR